MKRTILFFMVLTFSAVTFSCSGDDDSSYNNEVYQKLIGKWYFQDPDIDGYDYNNSFTFSSNGNVTYRYWIGIGDEFESEIGSFSVNGDILTMIYPEGVELVFVQRVVFLSENKVQFVQVEGSNEEPYDGTYYKAE